MKANKRLRAALLSLLIVIAGAAAAVPSPAQAIGCGIDPNGED